MMIICVHYCKMICSHFANFCAMQTMQLTRSMLPQVGKATEELVSMGTVKLEICRVLTRRNNAMRPGGAHFRRNLAAWALNAKRHLQEYSEWAAHMGQAFATKVASPSMVKIMKLAQSIEV